MDYSEIASVLVGASSSFVHVLVSGVFFISPNEVFGDIMVLASAAAAAA